MKNQVKRWTAFALVMAMIFSVITPVFADNEDTSSKCKVTVSGSAELAGSKVYAIQGFSAEKNTASEGEEVSYSYTITEDFKTFLTYVSTTGEGENATVDYSALQTYGIDLTDVDTSDKTAFSAAVYKALTEMNAANLRKLGEDIEAYLKKLDFLQYYDTVATFTANEDETSATATLDLNPGYYIFVSEKYDNMVPVITTVTKNLEISMKSDNPDVDKTVYDEEAKEYVDSKETIIGKVETFKLETYIPYVDEDKLGLDGTKATFSFAFVDELTKGLALIDKNTNQGLYTTVTNEDESVNYIVVTDKIIANALPFTVYLDNKPLQEDQYTVSAVDKSTRKFRIDITDLSLFKNENAGRTLTVVYQAIVTPEATTDTPAGIVGINSAYLEYEHNGKIVTTSEDTVTLIDITITIDKWTTTALEGAETIDRGNGEYSLNGAKFILYRDVVVDGKTVTQYYSKETTTDESDNTVETGKFIWVEGKDKAYQFVTEGDGQVKITQLTVPDEADTYYLEEVEAPNDYVRYAKPLTLVITNNGVGSDARTPQLELRVDSQLTTTWTVSVQNEPEGWLPSTGSIGTYLFIAAGVALIIGATLLKKRPNSAK